MNSMILELLPHWCVSFVSIGHRHCSYFFLNESLANKIEHVELSAFHFTLDLFCFPNLLLVSNKVHVANIIANSLSRT